MTTSLVLGWALFALPGAMIDVPLTDLREWTRLTYRNIPPNKVTVSDESLHISVDRSSSPLVYKLRAPTRVTGFSVSARWSGELRIPGGAVQGGSGADDFVLKFGLVEAGDTTLNWLQRRIAAEWVRELYRLAPDGSGVGRVSFYTTTQQQPLLGSERVHPLHDLLHETRLRYLDSPGEFELSASFTEPVEIFGLWLSADGDDTASHFDLRVDRIVLTTD